MIAARGGEADVGNVAPAVVDTPPADDAEDFTIRIPLAKIDVGGEFGGLPDDARPADMGLIAAVDALPPQVVAAGVGIVESLGPIDRVDARGFIGAGIFELRDVGGREKFDA